MLFSFRAGPRLLEGSKDHTLSPSEALATGSKCCLALCLANWILRSGGVELNRETDGRRLVAGAPYGLLLCKQQTVNLSDQMMAMEKEVSTSLFSP